MSEANQSVLIRLIRLNPRSIMLYDLIERVNDPNDPNDDPDIRDYDPIKEENDPNEEQNNPIERQNDPNDDPKEIFLAVIAQNPFATYMELAKAIDRSPSTVKRHIKELRESGNIFRSDGARTGKWVIR